jgi:beta-N-acetylhexosaminidase
MSAHILFTALDPDFPATVSPTILDGYLRGTLGFRGVTITDAMDMQAVARYGRLESVRMALQAGADLVLLGHVDDQLELIELMRPLARPAALARIQALRDSDPDSWPALAVVGCADHQTIAQTIAERSITLVRDSGRLPLRPRPDDTIAVITPEPINLTPADTSADVPITLAKQIQARHPRTLAFELPSRATLRDINAVLDAVQDAPIVIVGTTVAERDEAQAALVRAIHTRGQNPLVVSLRTPYDLTAFPVIETYLCAYGTRPASMEAVARVLFGEIEPRGILPCPIPGISEAQPA